MANDLHGFTNAEKKRIDEILSSDLSGLSAEDVELYGRWNAAVAEAQTQARQDAEAISERAALRLQLAEAEHANAQTAFESMYNAALARLEAASNG